MVDIPADATTTAVMQGTGTAASFSGRLETAGDHDWIRLDITGPGTLNFFAHMSNIGVEFGDAVLTLRDSTGAFVAGNDDRAGGPVGGRNSFFTHTFTGAGTFYLDIGDLGDNDIGSYTISATFGNTTIVNAGETINDDSITAAATGTFMGDRGDDVINLNLLGNDAFGEQGDDQLAGTGSDNRMFGGLGSDLLNGFGGNDTLFGDAGDDSLFGGSESDSLFGGDGFDILNGGDDGDELYGGEGQDNLSGGGSSDNLIGGDGADLLAGGLGDDNYALAEQADTIIEAAGEGSADAVTVAASFALAADDDIEFLVVEIFNSTTAINLTGNAIAQIIRGNNGANIIDGGSAGSDGAVDALTGYQGNDTYVLGNGADTVDETTFGAGIDTITSSITRSLLSYTNIENLTLTGSGAANATGTAGANVLIGNAGVNRIEGGAGKDTETGGLGNDRFVFKTAADSLVGGNRDTITDFTVAGTLERIDLSAFAGSFAFRGTGAFTSAAKEISYKFSGAKTLVRIDLDGDTAAEMEIMLIGHKVLTATDFFL